LEQDVADPAGLGYDHVAARISLRVLAAVGLTGAVSGRLAGAGIRCNVIAGYRHDHLLVPQDRATDVLRILQQLGSTAQPATV
jgi:hypothetical protein